MQERQSAANKTAWSYRAYEHWVKYSGPPEEAAARMREDPAAFLEQDRLYLGEVKGKRILNLLGSNGRKAVPLALLGAQVTVVDIAPEGARYARELALAAGVQINYIVADVTELSAQELASRFDLVYMEGGIFHYFADLGPIAKLVQDVLAGGGRLVARDFHPIRKCLTIEEGKVSVVGDYFDSELNSSDVAYQQFFPGVEQADFPKCQLRFWTLGEIVSAFADSGMVIEQLVEVPYTQCAEIPGQFVLTAIKLTGK
jgi:SAM-dependent methyltransferase